MNQPLGPNMRALFGEIWDARWEAEQRYRIAWQMQEQAHTALCNAVWDMAVREGVENVSERATRLKELYLIAAKFETLASRETCRREPGTNS